MKAIINPTLGLIMKEINQRIKIAQIMGWSNIQDPIIFSAVMRTPAGYAPGTDGPYFSTITDYLHDLNSCHEFEKYIRENSLWSTYCLELETVCSRTENWDYWVAIEYAEHAIGASAPERCEAFLKIMNKWETV